MVYYIHETFSKIIVTSETVAVLKETASNEGI